MSRKTPYLLTKSLSFPPFLIFSLYLACNVNSQHTLEFDKSIRLLEASFLVNLDEGGVSVRSFGGNNIFLEVELAASTLELQGSMKIPHNNTPVLGPCQFSKLYANCTGPGPPTGLVSSSSHELVEVNPNSFVGSDPHHDPNSCGIASLYGGQRFNGGKKNLYIRYQKSPLCFGLVQSRTKIKH
jgi:hypothetical protein